MEKLPGVPMNEAPMTVGELQALLSRAPSDLPIQLSIGSNHDWLHEAAWDVREKYAVLSATEQRTAA